MRRALVRPFVSLAYPVYSVYFEDIENCLLLYMTLFIYLKSVHVCTFFRREKKKNEIEAIIFSAGYEILKRFKFSEFSFDGIYASLRTLKRIL